MGSGPIVSRETRSLVQLREEALQALTPIYGPEESRAIIRHLLSYFLPDWQVQWLASRGKAPFPAQLLPDWHAALTRLLAHEPLAYITGKVEFLGLELSVRHGVFIPRPETEAWVYALIQHLKPSPPKTILDIGTGSGAIALALACAFPEAAVYAVEKTPLAVETAHQNALRHHLNLTLAQITFGKDPLPASWPTTWDLIVSNPPYIPHWAYAETELRVRLYEPHEALFCKEIEPTREILAFASKVLNANGLCIIEIFPEMAPTLLSLCKELGLKCELRHDFSGLPRTLWVRR